MTDLTFYLLLMWSEIIVLLCEHVEINALNIENFSVIETNYHMNDVLE